jgi:hypothetical protein
MMARMLVFSSIEVRVRKSGMVRHMSHHVAHVLDGLFESSDALGESDYFLLRHLD